MGCFTRALVGCTRFRVVLVAIALTVCPLATADAQGVRMKDGRRITGRMMPMTGVTDKPDAALLAAGVAPTGPILMLDDELRRVFVPRMQVAEVLEEAPEPWVVIKPWQNPAQGAARLVAVGPSLGITPFDEYGRRIYEMQLGDGAHAVVQGITELTPYYAKVESLLGPKRPLSWEMRLATSSLPRETVAAILAKNIQQDNWQARVQAVRFYAQAGRHPDALRELERIVEEFPEQADLKNEIAQLRQIGAEQLFKELAMRQAAGQHKLVKELLDIFPAEEASGETLAKVRELIAKYDQSGARIKQIGQHLQATVAGIADADNRGLAAPIAEEIVREMNSNTVDRLTPFVQLLDDSSLTPEEKASLAITGWFLGQDQAVQELPVAISLVKVRDAVVRYLREPESNERQLIFDTIESAEGASVEQVARLIAKMKPPWHDPELVAKPDGFLEMSAPGQTTDGDFQYLVQLPPEYDPYRLYPTLVVLNGAYNSPIQELEFWAGSPPPAANDEPSIRRGQAMRQGYITIAIDWHKPHQYEYEYTSREHVAVLTCLRDASRRFSIDADRVFLTGHDIGGEAAWDMAQAHPDLWAGAIPFGPRDEQDAKYVSFYHENAQYVPLYFVAGELDGRTIAANAPVWNKYLRSAKYDTTLVELQGRGHEPFHDEVLKLFEWMNLKKRNGPPAEFDCSTLRPWDNFFWWVECDEFPAKYMVHPTDWASGKITPAHVQGRRQSENNLSAKTVAERTTIWLGPDFVNFDAPLKVSFNGRKLTLPEGSARPSLGVLLEDVRTRGDRQRPFWAKIEVR